MDGLCAPGTQLHDLCTTRAINSTVVLTFCNHGFCDLLRNWLHTVKGVGITNYVIVSLDKRSHDELLVHGIETFLYSPNNKVYGEQSANFGTVEFTAICNEKPALVAEIVKGGFHVLWVDSDIVFYKNPLPHMANIPGDLVLQCDDDDICAGYFLARQSPRTAPFLDKVAAYTNALIDDQVSLRRHLAMPDEAEKLEWVDCEGNVVSDCLLSNLKLSASVKERPLTGRLQYTVLDRVHYPNGTAYYNAKLPQRLGVTPVMVHNNCLIGRDSKISRFAMYGQWHLPTVPTHEISIAAIINEPLAVLKAHMELVASALWLPQRQVLLSGSHDKTLRVWKLDDNNNASLQETHVLNKRGGVWCMAVSEDESLLYSGGHDRLAFAWTTADYSEAKRFGGHVSVVNALCLHRGVLFTASDDGDVFSWNVVDGKRERIYRSHSSWVSQIVAAGPILYSASHDHTARAWEISSGRVLQVYQHGTWVRALVLVKSKLLTGDDKGALRVWSVREGECLGCRKTPSGVGTLVVDEARHVVYSGHDDGVIRAWKIHVDDEGVVMQHVADYTGHTAPVTSLALAPLGDGFLFSGSFDRTVCQWRVVQ